MQQKANQRDPASRQCLEIELSACPLCAWARPYPCACPFCDPTYYYYYCNLSEFQLSCTGNRGFWWTQLVFCELQLSAMNEILLGGLVVLEESDWEQDFKLAVKIVQAASQRKLGFVSWAILWCINKTLFFNKIVQAGPHCSKCIKTVCIRLHNSTQRYLNPQNLWMLLFIAKETLQRD